MDYSKLTNINDSLIEDEEEKEERPSEAKPARGR